ncbi:uncharacterized protein LOC116339675 [Contarinia nasturtii]|uniref:uncharacterized protein LOC116339675 n=1 Tax=Contarinia nasturtii TaxID=265458 RepID=UPI0012D3AF25|nr:uncharacterized protein LOC116339675 [Contarinia nasturtii]
MEKFKVLKLNQKYMEYLAIYSYNLREPTNEFYRRPMTYHFLAVMVLTQLFSARYVLKYWKLNPFPAIGASKVVMGTTQCAACLLSVGTELKKVKAVHLILQDIVDTAENPEIYNIYWETEQKCRKSTFRLICYPFYHVSGWFITIAFVMYDLSFGNGYYYGYFN